MFETDETELGIKYAHQVNDNTKGQEVSLELWAEHFNKPVKERYKKLCKIFEKEFSRLKSMYCFLEKDQINGLTLSKFGIPNICGQVCRKFLQDYRKLSKRCTKVNTQRGNKPLLYKTKQSKQAMFKKQYSKKTVVSRYPPIAKRWPKVPAVPSSVQNSVDLDIPQNLGHSDDNERGSLKNDSSEFWSVASVINLSLAKKSALKVESEKLMKKAVRFNEDKLCSFEPTQESFDRSPIFTSAKSEIKLSGAANKMEHKTLKPEDDVNLPRLIIKLSSEATSENSKNISKITVGNLLSMCNKTQKISNVSTMQNVNLNDYQNIEESKFLIKPYNESNFKIEESNFSFSGGSNSNIDDIGTYINISRDKSLAKKQLLLDNTNSSKVKLADVDKILTPTNILQSDKIIILPDVEEKYIPKPELTVNITSAENNSKLFNDDSLSSLSLSGRDYISDSSYCASEDEIIDLTQNNDLKNTESDNTVLTHWKNEEIFNNQDMNNGCNNTTLSSHANETNCTESIHFKHNVVVSDSSEDCQTSKVVKLGDKLLQTTTISENKDTFSEEEYTHISQKLNDFNTFTSMSSATISQSISDSKHLDDIPNSREDIIKNITNNSSENVREVILKSITKNHIESVRGKANTEPKNSDSIDENSINLCQDIKCISNIEIDNTETEIIESYNKTSNINNDACINRLDCSYEFESSLSKIREIKSQITTPQFNSMELKYLNEQNIEELNAPNKHIKHASCPISSEVSHSRMINHFVKNNVKIRKTLFPNQNVPVGFDATTPKKIFYDSPSHTHSNGSSKILFGNENAISLYSKTSESSHMETEDATNDPNHGEKEYSSLPTAMAIDASSSDLADSQNCNSSTKFIKQNSKNVQSSSYSSPDSHTSKADNSFQNDCLKTAQNNNLDDKENTHYRTSIYQDSQQISDDEYTPVSDDDSTDIWKIKKDRRTINDTSLLEEVSYKSEGSQNKINLTTLNTSLNTTMENKECETDEIIYEFENYISTGISNHSSIMKGSSVDKDSLDTPNKSHDTYKNIKKSPKSSVHIMPTKFQSRRLTPLTELTGNLIVGSNLTQQTPKERDQLNYNKTFSLPNHQPGQKLSIYDFPETKKVQTKNFAGDVVEIKQTCEQVETVFESVPNKVNIQRHLKYTNENRKRYLDMKDIVQRDRVESNHKYEKQDILECSQSPTTLYVNNTMRSNDSQTSNRNIISIERRIITDSNTIKLKNDREISENLLDIESGQNTSIMKEYIKSNKDDEYQQWNKNDITVERKRFGESDIIETNKKCDRSQLLDFAKQPDKLSYMDLMINDISESDTHKRSDEEYIFGEKTIYAGSDIIICKHDSEISENSLDVEVESNTSNKLKYVKYTKDGAFQLSDNKDITVESKRFVDSDIIETNQKYGRSELLEFFKDPDVTSNVTKLTNDNSKMCSQKFNENYISQKNTVVVDSDIIKCKHDSEISKNSIDVEVGLNTSMNEVVKSNKKDVFETRNINDITVERKRFVESDIVETNQNFEKSELTDCDKHPDMSSYMNTVINDISENDFHQTTEDEYISAKKTIFADSDIIKCKHDSEMFKNSLDIEVGLNTTSMNEVVKSNKKDVFETRNINDITVERKRFVDSDIIETNQKYGRSELLEFFKEPDVTSNVTKLTNDNSKMCSQKFNENYISQKNTVVVDSDIIKCKHDSEISKNSLDIEVGLNTTSMNEVVKSNKKDVFETRNINDITVERKRFIESDIVETNQNFEKSELTDCAKHPDMSSYMNTVINDISESDFHQTSEDEYISVKKTIFADSDIIKCKHDSEVSESSLDVEVGQKITTMKDFIKSNKEDVFQSCNNNDISVDRKIFVESDIVETNLKSDKPELLKFVKGPVVTSNVTKMTIDNSKICPQKFNENYISQKNTVVIDSDIIKCKHDSEIAENLLDVEVGSNTSSKLKHVKYTKDGAFQRSDNKDITVESKRFVDSDIIETNQKYDKPELLEFVKGPVVTTYVTKRTNDTSKIGSQKFNENYICQKKAFFVDSDVIKCKDDIEVPNNSLDIKAGPNISSNKKSVKYYNDGAFKLRDNKDITVESKRFVDSDIVETNQKCDKPELLEFDKGPVVTSYVTKMTNDTSKIGSQKFNENYISQKKSFFVDSDVIKCKDDIEVPNNSLDIKAGPNISSRKKSVKYYNGGAFKLRDNKGITVESKRFVESDIIETNQKCDKPELLEFDKGPVVTSYVTKMTNDTSKIGSQKFNENYIFPKKTFFADSDVIKCKYDSDDSELPNNSLNIEVDPNISSRKTNVKYNKDGVFQQFNKKEITAKKRLLLESVIVETNQHFETPEKLKFDRSTTGLYNIQNIYKNDSETPSIKDISAKKTLFIDSDIIKCNHAEENYDIQLDFDTQLNQLNMNKTVHDYCAPNKNDRSVQNTVIVESDIIKFKESEEHKNPLGFEGNPNSTNTKNFVKTANNNDLPTSNKNDSFAGRTKFFESDAIETYQTVEDDEEQLEIPLESYINNTVQDPYKICHTFNKKHNSVEKTIFIGSDVIVDSYNTNAKSNKTSSNMYVPGETTNINFPNFSSSDNIHMSSDASINMDEDLANIETYSDSNINLSSSEGTNIMAMAYRKNLYMQDITSDENNETIRKRKYAASISDYSSIEDSPKRRTMQYSDDIVDYYRSGNNSQGKLHHYGSNCNSVSSLGVTSYKTISDFPSLMSEDGVNEKSPLNSEDDILQMFSEDDDSSRSSSSNDGMQY